MKRLRGKNAGEHLTLHQWANDWISADTDDGRGVIVGPTAVEVDDPDELAKLLADQASYARPHHAGEFWTLWELSEDGRFTRRKRS